MKIRTCKDGWKCGFLTIISSVPFVVVMPNIGLVFTAVGVAMLILNHIAHWLWD